MNRVNKKNSAQVRALRHRTALFKTQTGRGPRILLVPLNANAKEYDLKLAATQFADCGIDVDMGPAGLSPKAMVHMAVENDVHLVVLQGNVADHSHLQHEIHRHLKSIKAVDIALIVMENGINFFSFADKLMTMLEVNDFTSD